MARFVVQGDPQEGKLNLAFAARWLAYESGRNVLNPFVPEVAPAAALASIAYTPLFSGTVEGWIVQVRRLAVTHVVVSQPNSIRALKRSEQVRATWQGGQLVIFELLAEPGRLVGALLDVSGSTKQWGESAGDISIRYELPSSLTTTLVMGWSPKWKANIDADSVTLRRSGDNLLEIDLPPGVHTLTLRFMPDRADLWGRGLTVLTVTSIVAYALRSKLRPKESIMKLRDVARPRPGGGGGGW